MSGLRVQLDLSRAAPPAAGGSGQRASTGCAAARAHPKVGRRGQNAALVVDHHHSKAI